MRLHCSASATSTTSKCRPSDVPSAAVATSQEPSHTVSCELDAIGAYSFNEGGQLMANVSVLPFGGAPSLGVAYVAGISLISNMHTAERMEAWRRLHAFCFIRRSPAGPSSTTVVQGGRHGSLCAFVAHTEQAKMESTVMITKQEGRLSKLDEAMVKSNKMMRNLVMAIGPNDQQTKVLTGRVGVIGEKAD